VRVVIADDDDDLRQLYVEMLEECGFVVAAACVDAEQLVAEVVRQAPDLVVTDVRMPPARTDEGLAAAARLRQATPTLPVLVLSQSAAAFEGVGAIVAQPGGFGYLMKQRLTDPKAFCQCTTGVLAGGIVLDRELVGRLIDRLRRVAPRGIDLDPRYRDMTCLAGEGWDDARIAAHVRVPVTVVAAALSAAWRQLGVPGDASAPDRGASLARCLTSM
jgi:DNA-binding NarL/FixJ family response regulator